jgi:hypothetical protein
MVDIVIVHGPPGAGKSYLIAQKYADYKKLDMDDLRHELEGKGVLNSYENYRQRMNLLESRLLSLSFHKDVKIVIEGIFAPGTESYRWLVGMLKNMDLSFSFVRPEYTLATALRHLLIDFGKDWDEERLRGRAELLIKYHRMF